MERFQYTHYCEELPLYPQPRHGLQICDQKILIIWGALLHEPQLDKQYPFFLFLAFTVAIVASHALLKGLRVLHYFLVALLVALLGKTVQFSANP